jgi:hypothetical protein
MIPQGGTVSNNWFWNCAYGIQFWKGNFVRIANNHFWGERDTNPGFAFDVYPWEFYNAIRVNGHNITISGNTFMGYQRAIQCSGGGINISGNSISGPQSAKIVADGWAVYVSRLGGVDGLLDSNLTALADDDNWLDGGGSKQVYTNGESRPNFGIVISGNSINYAYNSAGGGTTTYEPIRFTSGEVAAPETTKIHASVTGNSYSGALDNRSLTGSGRTGMIAFTGDSTYVRSDWDDPS